MYLMKHVAFLSISLVALSGTAGLGLSSLHDFNMNVQTSALATPDSIPAESGFVIPDYVPEADQFTSVAPTLDAPAAFETPAAPVETAALGDLDMVPQDVPAAVQLAPEVRKAVTAPATRSFTPKARAAETSVFVDQTQSFTHTPDASTRIDYVIGVYR